MQLVDDLQELALAEAKELKLVIQPEDIARIIEQAAWKQAYEED
jgi:hypothetical protein